MVILISGKQRAGKDTTAKMLSNFWEGAEIIHFADKLKDLARELFDMQGKDRQLLIDLGSKMRSIDPDVWVRYALKKMEAEPDKIWIVPDWRFKNEEEYIKNNSNQEILTIRVHASSDIRKSRGASYYEAAEEDPSEKDLDSHGFDYVFRNEDTLEDLYTLVVGLAILEGWVR